MDPWRLAQQGASLVHGQLHAEGDGFAHRGGRPGATRQRQAGVA